MSAPCCTRKIAAGIVAGAPSEGRIWRHDPLERPSRFGDALVSCDGSLEIIDLKLPGIQMELGGDEPEPELETAPDGPLGTVLCSDPSDATLPHLLTSIFRDGLPT